MSIFFSIIIYGFMAGITVVILRHISMLKDIDEEVLFPIYLFSAGFWPFFLPLWSVIATADYAKKKLTERGVI